MIPETPPASSSEIPMPEQEVNLPEKIQIRLLTPLRSDEGGNSLVAAEVTHPNELAGARVEGNVIDSKSSGKVDGTSRVELKFVTLQYGDKTLSIDSQVAQLRNSRGASGVDDHGSRLNSKNGVIKKGKNAVTRFGSAIGGLFGRSRANGAASGSATTVLSTSAPRIEFLRGSEFELNLVAWGQVSDELSRPPSDPARDERASPQE